MRIIVSFAFFVITLVSGCGSEQNVQSPTSNVQIPSTPVSSPQVTSAENEGLQNQIKEIAAEAKGKVGVTAVALDSGETLASLNPHEHFPMQSVYKLPISMAVMKQVDAGKLKLADKIQVLKSEMVGRRAHSPIRDRHPNGTSVTLEDLLRYAIAESDGTASDVLMRLVGGPSGVQAYLTELGIKDMIVLDTEQTFSQNNTAQYRNWATPEASVALLRALHERRGMSESSQVVLLKFMTESKPGKKRLKGLLPAGTAVAHKTGTSGTDKGVTAATNDIGIITLPNGKRVAIAVFVADSPADEATREGVIAKIARAVYDAASVQ
ncbi:MAG TPA: class A beta-lactamase [Pyrinomonadaceae bacterium]|nr:class A beta-lactamase [Pyrinomonadaceae bacterium]